MKVEIRYPGNAPKMIEGSEARHEVKLAVRDIMGCLLIPEPPFTTKMRKRVFTTLKSGKPIWTINDSIGQAHRDATILRVLPKIVGIIRADGTWDGAGPDPRLPPSPAKPDPSQP